MDEYARQFTIWGVDLAKDSDGTPAPEGQLSVEIQFQDDKWPQENYMGFLVGEGDSVVKISGNMEVTNQCAL
jgi:hypothetical protein